MIMTINTIYVPQSQVELQDFLLSVLAIVTIIALCVAPLFYNIVKV